ncbi:MAG: heme-binding domain-containing protein [Ignavibacteria bacterium]|nr:heme-binding domain-containing protein [Ignavibacteria bacterium]MBT8381434.1 heme-binding domain-containing protein [Ignavibacteria bacterium]MBT8392283.1 heme-binding domain-containing protein [Ignavibacteria bacterium]NNJ52292.1 heme-binding domain-containing protein [Ignavibacteriaceae bacterium]NNL20382.1 heme-binding domain-containing protein [Ignavibacteriaceae bacterium]
MKKSLIVLAFIVVGIQFIPVERSNPPITGEINAPSNIKAILKKSCYDCHSNETHYAWYAYVAPVSFLVAKDVNNGRRSLNFSEWNKYDKEKREKILEVIMKEVNQGTMPLSIYTLVHPSAKLDPLKIKTLSDWVNKRGGMGKTLRQEKLRK